MNSEPFHAWLNKMAEANWRIERDIFGGVIRLVCRDTGAIIEGSGIWTWAKLGIVPPTEEKK